MIKEHVFHEWTKKLGQKHWSMIGEHETLCGRPMLGNNYASDLEDKFKTPCEDCKIVREAMEEMG